MSDPWDADGLQDRLGRAARLAADVGLGALLITPGADLRYLTGYVALPLERLTCLVVRGTGDPVLVVPRLEVAAAAASPVGPLGDLSRTYPSYPALPVSGL